jgi:thymidylate synthase (FAD)
MNVRLVSITPDAEKTMAYIARVSNPSNQDNENFAGLLRYCIKHQHWSVFEQSSMTLEIETTRGLAAQILRHRSFTFQEFSQRYADSNLLGEIELPELRRQDTKNRQNSIDDLDPAVVEKLEKQMNTLFSSSLALYNQMLESGVAKELDSYYHLLLQPDFT